MRGKREGGRCRSSQFCPLSKEAASAPSGREEGEELQPGRWERERDLYCIPQPTRREGPCPHGTDPGLLGRRPIHPPPQQGSAVSAPRSARPLKVEQAPPQPHPRPRGQAPWEARSLPAPTQLARVLLPPEPRTRSVAHTHRHTCVFPHTSPIVTLGHGGTCPPARHMLSFYAQSPP